MSLLCIIITFLLTKVVPSKTNKNQFNAYLMCLTTLLAHNHYYAYNIKAYTGSNYSFIIYFNRTYKWLQMH